MSKNPLINALVGLLYIVLIVSLFQFAPIIFGKEDNTVLIPIATLSLFVFSAACMGYIFLYEPLQLFIEGQKKESVNLFIRTLIAFALSSALLVLIGLAFQAYL